MVQPQSILQLLRTTDHFSAPLSLPLEPATMLPTATEPLQAHEQKQQGTSAAVGFSFLTRRSANPNDALPVNEKVTIENATANHHNDINIDGNSHELPYRMPSPVTDMGMVETRTTANKAPSVPSTKTPAMTMITARAAAAQMGSRPLRQHDR